MTSQRTCCNKFKKYDTEYRHTGESKYTDYTHRQKEPTHAPSLSLPAGTLSDKRGEANLNLICHMGTEVLNTTTS